MRTYLIDEDEDRIDFIIEAAWRTESTDSKGFKEEIEEEEVVIV